MSQGRIPSLFLKKKIPCFLSEMVQRMGCQGPYGIDDTITPSYRAHRGPSGLSFLVLIKYPCPMMIGSFTLFNKTLHYHTLNLSKTN